MPTLPPTVALLAAVERYLDLMFDNDVSRFDEVFAPSAQLHGLRTEIFTCCRRRITRRRSPPGHRRSPRTRPRQQEVLLVDFASPTQALVKVRVRIDTAQYLDYLSFHCVKDAWQITAKSFHMNGDTTSPPADAVDVDQAGQAARMLPRNFPVSLLSCSD